MTRQFYFVPVMVLLLTASLRAQPNTDRFDRQLEQIRRETRVRPNENLPFEQRTFVDAGAALTLSYLSLDDPNGNNVGLRQFDLTAYGHVSLDGVHDFLIRGRAFYEDFNPGDSFDGSGDNWDGRVERAYYRFDLGRYLESRGSESPSNNLAIKAGRDLVIWANGLTLSTELDGVTIDFDLGPATVQVIAGVTAPYVVDIDSSRPDFDEHTRRGMFGVMLSDQLANHRPYIYGLVQRDYNDDVLLSDIDGDGLPEFTTNYDYNSFYIGIGSSGALSDRLAYGVEVVYEGGSNLSSSIVVDAGGIPAPAAQEKTDINAWAADAQLDYLVGDVNRTRVSTEMILASGDPDRLTTSNTFGGNAPGTNDRAFNAFGLVNTGMAFAPNPSNLIALRGGFSTYPASHIQAFRRMQVGFDAFVFAKMLADAPIDEVTKNDHFLGIEPDLYINWQLTSDVSLSIRYGIFFPGDAIPVREPRQFIYTGVTFAF